VKRAHRRNNGRSASSNAVAEGCPQVYPKSGGEADFDELAEAQIRQFLDASV
jgi:hypothetical protein